jgi:pimeloyl-ACP methyl ester carboxylesterase
VRFLLVHGARHGAWCWDALIAELEQRGHEAVAVDLPADDESAGAARYAEVAANAIGGPGWSVVGHSLGGLVIPLIPGLADVRELVFLCAPLPVPGRSLWEQARDEPEMFVADSVQPEARRPGEMLEATEEYALRIYYHDVPEQAARAAARSLRRQSTIVTNEPSPVMQWPPAVQCRYILGSHDRIVNPDWSRRAVPERLGIEPLEIATGHSPFLARPAELAELLAA